MKKSETRGRGREEAFLNKVKENNLSHPHSSRTRRCIFPMQSAYPVAIGLGAGSTGALDNSVVISARDRLRVHKVLNQLPVLPQAGGDESLWWGDRLDATDGPALGASHGDDRPRRPDERRPGVRRGMWRDGSRVGRLERCGRAKDCGIWRLIGCAPRGGLCGAKEWEFSIETDLIGTARIFYSASSGDECAIRDADGRNAERGCRPCVACASRAAHDAHQHAASRVPGHPLA